jgi:hypothetical protein
MNLDGTPGPVIRLNATSDLETRTTSSDILLATTQ